MHTTEEQPVAALPCQRFRTSSNPEELLLPWPAQVVRAVERLGAHVDKARIKRTLHAMICFEGKPQL